MVATVLLLGLPGPVQAQLLEYAMTNGVVTITGSTGSGGLVTIPSRINGLPVVSIAGYAFEFCSPTNVIIPNSVTNISDLAFIDCPSLTGLTVDASNLVYSSLDGVLFDSTQTTLLAFPQGRGGSYTIPSSVKSLGYLAFGANLNLTDISIGTSVTNIGDYAFNGCSGLTTVAMANGVISIGRGAFQGCSSLRSITIPGSVTRMGAGAFSSTGLVSAHFLGESVVFESGVFDGNYVTVYYLPGSKGASYWLTSGAAHVILWNARIQSGTGGFALGSDPFGFTITGNQYLVIVVETCTDLSNPVWSPLQTNTLTGDLSYFVDTAWVNHPTRFYRLRWP